MTQAHGDAARFKTSLEGRLRRDAAAEGERFADLQLKFMMERLLARLFRTASPPWRLKGGFAMDLRYRPRVRATKDLDLTMSAPPGPPAELASALQDLLREAASADLGDHIEFGIGDATRELTNAPGGGATFRCQVFMLEKRYLQFMIDVGCGDPAALPPDELVGRDLGLPGLDPIRVMAIGLPQQFAEKIHAYTFPWEGRQNTRVKDLVDMALIAERTIPDPEAYRVALAATFAVREGHAVPAELPSPPESWAVEFPELARQAAITPQTPAEALRVVADFWARHGLGVR